MCIMYVKPFLQFHIPPIYSRIGGEPSVETLCSISDCFKTLHVKADINVAFFIIIFKLTPYTACSWVGRKVFRHAIPNFLLNFLDIAYIENAREKKIK